MLRPHVLLLVALMSFTSCSSSEKRSDARKGHETCAACRVFDRSQQPISLSASGGPLHDDAIEALRVYFERHALVVKTNPGKSKRNPLRSGLQAWPDLIVYESGSSEPAAIVEVETDDLSGQLDQWKKYAAHGVPLHLFVPEGRAATRAVYWVREHDLTAPVWTYKTEP